MNKLLLKELRILKRKLSRRADKAEREFLVVPGASIQEAQREVNKVAELTEAVELLSKAIKKMETKHD